MTHSDDICDYVQAIREQDARFARCRIGTALVRRGANVACVLDAYLLLIVDAIEEATGRKFERPTRFGALPVAGGH
jgi:hypothetical protein